MRITTTLLLSTYTLERKYSGWRDRAIIACELGIEEGAIECVEVFNVSLIGNLEARVTYNTPDKWERAMPILE